MKKLLLTILVGLVALGVMAQESKFTLTGTVKGLSMAYHVLTDAKGDTSSDGMLFFNAGKVDLSFDVEEVGWLMLVASGRVVLLPAVPGEAVTINGDFDNYTLDGSALYKEYNEFVTTARPLLAASSKYDFKQACKDEIAGMTSEQVFDLYQRKMRENSQPVTDAVMDFVSRHADHESSMMVLNFLNYAEDMEKARELISETVFNGRMRPLYEGPMERVTSFGASYPLNGKPAPDFKLKSIDGGELSLSSLRGKWVLLDFWSSTCDNALDQMPALKELYANYKNHVEVLGVDCEDEETDWQAAVSEYQLPWLNVLGSFDGDDSPVNLYHETATPAYVLITPSGRVAMALSSAEDAKYMCKLLFE